MRNPTVNRRGFTLLELMVVIGIIVLLVGMLLPVISKVRQSAHAANTQQEIASLTAAIEHYHQLYNAYPGPYSNDDVILGVKLLGASEIPGDPKKITMSENLVLGLSGGLALDASNSNKVTFYSNLVGTGPKTLVVGGRQGKPILESALDLSDGTTKVPGMDDSIVPEFMDRFPDRLPILYLRARSSATGVCSVNNQDQSNANAALNAQYDLNQFITYTSANAAYGLQKADVWVPLDSPTPPTAPYNALIFLMDPALHGASNAVGTPRQKDGYILISAGKDRLYGTDDDICNFGSLK